MASEILKKVNLNRKLKLANGKKVSNVLELYKNLIILKDNKFSKHLNESKNDFYKWVKLNYSDKKLADDLLECTTKEAVLFCLKSRLGKIEIKSKILKIIKTKRKSHKVKKLSQNNNIERFNKSQIKKINVQTPGEIIKKVREVCDID